MSFLQTQERLILDSYRHLSLPAVTGFDLGPSVFNSPFVILSHGTQTDPILNYGNRKALELWEMTWDEFTLMPSRLTAEPDLREDRSRLLEDVKKRGYSDRYSGIRISKTGKRFRIENATVWNLIDPSGRYAGQAACFGTWTYL